MGLLDTPSLIKDPDYKQKILLIDIETSPIISYTWGIWDQNVIEVKEEWYMLCFAYKWLGEKKTHIVALPDFKGYSKNKKNDEQLVIKLWGLLNQCEVVIAHNGDAFDLKKSFARFIFHGLEPPSHYQTIDTLKIARKHFKFDSNKLDYLGQYLKVGRKLPHTGKHLWFGCMEGDPKSWKLMKDYNIQDVELLEKVYLKLRGWDKTQKNNLNIVYQSNNCPKCHSSHIKRDGKELRASGVYQGYQCLNCGHRFRGEKLHDFKPILKS